MSASTPRQCPVCGSADQSRVFAEANIDRAKLDRFAFASRKMPEYMHHRLVECPVCDVVYASPLPSVDELSDAYRDAAFDSGAEAAFASKTYAKFLPQIAAKIPDKRGALDIATGDGAFLERLVEAGFSDVVGIEPSSAPIEAAKPQIKALIRNGLFNADDFADGSFSLITCFQTIEHLHDPLAMCKSAARLLKPGGVLFLIGHNRRALSAKILGKKSPIFDIEHLQLFSSLSFRTLLQNAGLTHVSVRTVVNRYPLHYWLKLLPLPRSMKPSMISASKKIRLGYLPLPMPAGNLAAIAQRP